MLALDARFYHDPDIWQRERQRVFAREWLWVGRLAQLTDPGSYFTATPAQYPVFVWRDPDGELRAFHNVCRHRAMQLLRGAEGRCSRLICPYHGWRYAHDGALEKAPHFGVDESFDPAALGLYPLRVACWQGLIFVCMNSSVPDFDQWFGPLKTDIDEFLSGQRVHHGDVGAEVACNWKNYVDNYQEGYHIPLVHPRLARDTVWEDYRVENLTGGSRHRVPPRGSSGQPGLFGWKWPNLMFNTYGRGISFMRIDPLGPQRCYVHYSHFRPQDMTAADYERQVVEYGWEISEEDQAITPLVQRNLEAGIYRAGPLSPRHENGLAHFHRMVRQALN